MRLNLNADLGESFGAWTMGDDASLLRYVDSANVACGFHAGDPLVISDTLENARINNVSVGAHPSFPDLQGFGRRPMTLGNAEIKAIVLYQLSALQGMARCYGMRLTHVKPHGAINNMACEDRSLAETIAAAVVQVDPSLIFLAPVLSELATGAQRAGLRVAGEIFADRSYADNGSLVSRRKPGAVLSSTEACISHARSMIAAGGLITLKGDVLPSEFHSICVHGDNAHAVETARCLREALLADGHEFCGLPELLADV